MAQKKKRGANGGGTIRQRSDGRWEARFITGLNPATGAYIRRSVYGSTQKEVRQKMTEAIAALDKGTYIPPTKLKVSDWFNTWLETFCKSKVKPLTYSHYESVIRNHIIPSMGAMELQAVKGVHVQQMYNALAKKGLSGKTISNISVVLHRGFQMAQKQGYIQANPCDGAELPKTARREIKPLTDEEIPLFLQAIESSPMRNAYALCLFAGLREGECLGLSWDCVDFQKSRITVKQQLQFRRDGSGYCISPSTKNGKTRTIEPPPIAFQYLKAERNVQIQNRFKAGDLWGNSDNLVFTDELGAHWSPRTFYKRFKMIAESIGRPDARPHDLRHTAAIVAIASGADIKSVQDMLGHATAAFTLNVYAHTSEQMMKDTASRVQGYYDNLSVEKMG